MATMYSRSGLFLYFFWSAEQFQQYWIKLYSTGPHEELEERKSRSEFKRELCCSTLWCWWRWPQQEKWLWLWWSEESELWASLSIFSFLLGKNLERLWPIECHIQQNDLKSMGKGSIMVNSRVWSWISFGLIHLRRIESLWTVLYLWSISRSIFFPRFLRMTG